MGRPGPAVGHSHYRRGGSGPRLARGEQDRDTKTPQSKRSLMLPKRAITALTAHKAMQDRERRQAGKARQDLNLVFCNQDGSMYTSRGLNWHFSKMTRKAGIGHWRAHAQRPMTCCG